MILKERRGCFSSFRIIIYCVQTMKKAKAFIIYFQVILYFSVVISCKEKQQEYRFVVNDQQLGEETMTIDTVLAFPRTFSGVGFWAFSDTNLYFFDQVFSTVISFDEAGKQSALHLGKGDGPDQVESLHDYVYSEEVGNLILSDFTFSVYDNNFQIKKSHQLIGMQPTFLLKN